MAAKPDTEGLPYPYLDEAASELIMSQSPRYLVMRVLGNGLYRLR